MIASLEYLSLDEALQFVPTKPTLAISILSPGREPASLHAEIKPVLRLYFEDTVKGVIASGIGVFTETQARRVIDFSSAPIMNIQNHVTC